MRKTLLAAAAAAAIAPLAAHATTGYFSHGYGIKAKAMGGVGIALPQDALAAATNPAGMAKPVPTPCPCVPVITGPWVPLAPTKLVNNKPILLQGSVAMCVWAGVIQATSPGSTKEMVS